MSCRLCRPILQRSSHFHGCNVFPLKIPPSVAIPLLRRREERILGRSIVKVSIHHPRLVSSSVSPSMADSSDSTTTSVLPEVECNGDNKRTEEATSTCSTAPNCTEIVLIRHGETDWNAVHRMQGHLDVELNDVGRQQAASVGERLSKEEKFSAIYSSDLNRAFETAQIIANICGGLEIVKDRDLRERHLGDLQGVVYYEAAKLVPKAHQALKSHRRDQDIPGGGESLDQVYQRCTSALQRIAEKHRGERVVVVTHGGVIRALHRRASSPGQSAGKILNTSVNVLLLSEDDHWFIKHWGDVSHLNQTGFLESGFGGDKNSG